MTPQDARAMTEEQQQEQVELGDVLDFMRSLWALDHALQSASKRMESTLGITGPQRLVIRIVGRYPGISAGRLATIMHVHPSTLTGVLSRLEQRGVLVRKEDPADRRRALFALTSRGTGLNVPQLGTVESAVESALGLLPPRAVKAAEQVLHGVTAALEGQREEQEAPAQARRAAAAPRARAAAPRASAAGRAAKKRPASRRAR